MTCVAFFSLSVLTRAEVDSGRMNESSIAHTEALVFACVLSDLIEEECFSEGVIGSCIPITFFIPLFAGSKTPASKFSKSKEDR